MRTIAAIFLAFFMIAGSALADQPKRYASIVVDADSLEIIHARQIDGQRFPASLTKVMTLYLTFDALDNGTLKAGGKLKISRKAAATPPVDIGLRAGKTISVEDAIQALTVRSANDAAVVLAERLAGSEEAFAELMTAKARELHMLHTTFKTANGLPHPEQTTTARDMAKLATTMLTDHRRYYHYFGQTHFNWNGRNYRNTNNLLHWMEGVDGFKTGYTNASGYNLIISAQRDGRRIVAVVLGGASGKSRDQHMAELIERSFKVIESRPRSVRQRLIVSEPIAEQAAPQIASIANAVRLRGHGKEIVSVTQGPPSLQVAGKDYDTAWSIQVGTFWSEYDARLQLSSIPNHRFLTSSIANIAPLVRNGQTLYGARFSALTAPQAQAICKSMPQLPSGCLVIAPGS